MATIDKEELLKIAKLSGLNMNASEVELFTGQIQKVLTFIDELQSVTITSTTQSVTNVNIFREDIPQPSQDTSPLELALEKDDGYFIVPKILDEK